MTPAELVIDRFEGVRPLARAIGVDHSWVSRWPKSRADGGADGQIPGVHHKKILHAAAEQGIPLTAEELIFGAPENEAKVAAAV